MNPCNSCVCVSLTQTDMFLPQNLSRKLTTPEKSLLEICRTETKSLSRKKNEFPYTAN